MASVIIQFILILSCFNESLMILREHELWMYRVVRLLYDVMLKYMETRGPFLERRDNLSGPKANFEIKISWINSRKVPRSQTGKFASLTDNFIVSIIFHIIERWSWMQSRPTWNIFLGQKSYRDFLERASGLWTQQTDSNLKCVS